jgi:hydrophobic/amphiphilic exporter-1 (mainly G- bacteria), HAE1 family
VIWVVRRPVATWMITIALFVFGMVSYQRLPLSLMPDLSYPTITIRTEADGYAPQEVEEQVSRRIEESIATTQGIAKIESRSRAGISEVLLSLNWGTDVNVAIQDVRERLQRVFFDADVQRPLILRYDPTLDPILRLALDKKPDIRESNAMALSKLRVIADRQIKRELEALDGIAAVRIRGGMEEEIQISIREEWMAARGLDIDQVINTLRTENINLPGGSIIEGEREFLVRTLNAFTSIEDLQNIKIRRNDGVEVALTEIADVEYGYKDRSVLSRIDGHEAVELEVYKSADANIVQVSQILKKELLGSGEQGWGGYGGTESIKDSLPEGVNLTLLEDQAAFIEASLNNLRSTAVFGAGLAMIVLFLFLRDFRSTAVISTAIPLSIVVTFAPMYIYDVSLNLMSLGGLALGIGMLVDNAVVVLENIQVYIEKGYSRKEAASKGTKEVALAVITSTLTTISVFLPITFVEGVAGQIFGDLSLAVVFSLLASLAVALFFVPMLVSTEFNAPNVQQRPSIKGRFQGWLSFREGWKERTGWKKILWLLWAVPRFLLVFSWEIISTCMVLPLVFSLWILFAVFRKIIPTVSGIMLAIANLFYSVYERLEHGYSSLFFPLFSRPVGVIATAALIFFGSLPLLFSLGQSLLPEIHQGRFTADVAFAIGTPLGKTSSSILDVEQKISDMKDVRYLYSIVGSDSRIDDRTGAGEHSVRLMIGLRDKIDSKGETQSMEAVRAELMEIEGIQSVQLKRPALFSFETPLELVIFAQKLDDLQFWSKEITQVLENIPGLTDIQTSLSAGYPEIQIEYERDKLRRLGLDASSAARIVREKIQGEKATRISTEKEQLDLTVRLVENSRRSQTQLERLNINPAVNPMIPLSAVAHFTQAEGPSEIRRIDQQRAVVVQANIEGFDLTGPATLIANAMEEQTTLGNRDDNISWEIAGQSQEMERSLHSMQLALYLAIFLVYVIMASSFESLLHPFIILFSVPLAFIGTIWCLALFGLPLNVIVFIGAIVLAGVVVNNAIVLVDTINRKIQVETSILEATKAAAQLRLRPILITTLTTTLGLLPLALGVGEGAEIQQPLALTVIAGLISSTLLTLVVIPAVFLVFNKDRTGKHEEDNLGQDFREEDSMGSVL